MQRKNEAEQLTAQTKTEERIFQEPRKESTDPNAGLKTEGPSQTSTPKKEKKRPEKVISKADRKTSNKKKKEQDLRSTPEPGGRRKSRRKWEEEVRAKAHERRL